jgi:hypothetical protein
LEFDSRIYKLANFQKPYQEFGILQKQLGDAIRKRKATDRLFVEQIEYCITKCGDNAVDFLSLLGEIQQRMPRYKMLFSALYDTTPTGHEDNDALYEAISKTQSIMSNIQEKLAQTEMVLFSMELSKKLNVDSVSLLSVLLFVPLNSERRLPVEIDDI